MEEVVVGGDGMTWCVVADGAGGGRVGGEEGAGEGWKGEVEVWGR